MKDSSSLPSNPGTHVPELLLLSSLCIKQSLSWISYTPVSTLNFTHVYLLPSVHLVDYGSHGSKAEVCSCLGYGMRHLFARGEYLDQLILNTDSVRERSLKNKNQVGADRKKEEVSDIYAVYHISEPTVIDETELLQVLQGHLD